MTTTKRYAYLMLDVLTEQRAGTEGASYNPEHAPQQGEIILEDKNHGTGTHTFQREDGPYVFTMTGVYVATGELNDENTVIFDYGAVRLLNLVMMGWNAEVILRSQIHEVVDGVKALIEEQWADAVPFAKLVEQIDVYEKNLWRKH